jgi:hypothetical protein
MCYNTVILPVILSIGGLALRGRLVKEKRHIKISLKWEILIIRNKINMSYEGSVGSFQYTVRISMNVN